MEELRLRAILEPDWFCESILHSPNDPWQSEMLNAVTDLDRIRLGVKTLYNHDGLNRFTIAAFHGPGKTHWVAKLMHIFNFTRVGRIVATGPKEKTVRTRLWPEFRKLQMGSQTWYSSLITVKASSIIWANDPDHCALIETASQPENLQGHHESDDAMGRFRALAFLIDEASSEKIDQMMGAVEGALTDPNSILAMIGNPTRSQGEFYDSHNRPATMRLYYRKQIQHSESNRVNQKWVDGMIAKYGRESPVVKVRVFGEFVDLSPNQLYAMEWLDRALNNESKADGSHPKRRLSVDVSDGGIDETVFTIGLHYNSGVDIVAIVRKSFPAATATIDAVDFGEKLFEVHGGRKDGGISGEDDVVVDGVGVGAGTAAEFVRRGWNTIKHKGGEAANDPRKYKNRRTQVYLVSRDFLRDDRVAFLPGAVQESDATDFEAQMLSIKTKPGVEKVEELQPKTEMIREGVKSPDIADSVSLQFATKESTDMELSDGGGFGFAPSSGASSTPWRGSTWRR